MAMLSSRDYMRNVQEYSGMPDFYIFFFELIVHTFLIQCNDGCCYSAFTPLNFFLKNFDDQTVHGHQGTLNEPSRYVRHGTNVFQFNTLLFNFLFVLFDFYDILLRVPPVFAAAQGLYF